jgi:hypothetical protein
MVMHLVSYVDQDLNEENRHRFTYFGMLRC